MNLLPSEGLPHACVVLFHKGWFAKSKSSKENRCGTHCICLMTHWRMWPREMINGSYKSLCSPRRPWRANTTTFFEFGDPLCRFFFLFLCTLYDHLFFFSATFWNCKVIYNVGDEIVTKFTYSHWLSCVLLLKLFNHCPWSWTLEQEGLWLLY